MQQPAQPAATGLEAARRCLAPLRDADLVDRLRRGDADTFAAVVQAYSPAMLHIARGFVASAAAAEDVVQEAWLAVITGLDRFQGRSSLRTWACAITANIARHHGSKESRTLPWSDAFPGDDGPTVDPARFRGAGDQWPGGWTPHGAPRPWAPEQGALDAEVRSLLSAALQQLPLRQRTVVALRDVDGLSAEEVCEAMQLTMSNQRVLLHRGRAQLRQLLEDYYQGRETP
jgi:RNA polymerase sigma-70 factor (ECF subfamily)